MKTVTIPSHCLVTIRSPNGNVETIKHPNVLTMTPKLWSDMGRAMKAAGRGECVSYENITQEVPEIEPTELERERELYEEERDAIYRMSAGGERVQ